MRVRVELGLRLVPALEELRQKAYRIHRVGARLLLRLGRAGAICSGLSAASAADPRHRRYMQAALRREDACVGGHRGQVHLERLQGMRGVPAMTPATGWAERGGAGRGGACKKKYTAWYREDAVT